MSFDTRAGTRGLPMEGSKLYWWMDRQMAKQSVRKVFALFGFDVAVLTTIGHRSGVRRTSQVCWFPGKDGSRLIVAAAGGTRANPAWYYNIAAHPDEVQIEIDGRTIAVTAEQLHGAERAQAWQQITAAAHRFAWFQSETDRELPVIRLTPQPDPAAPSDLGPEQQ
ncbi:MAG TPA: nitroreductase/quinone reductase family protein [Dermatophilaceae bacterium]|nr:nitroreductase/quinone reductase family protein [Dermatophilaceae bacterium]